MTEGTTRHPPHDDMSLDTAMGADQTGRTPMVGMSRDTTMEGHRVGVPRRPPQDGLASNVAEGLLTRDNLMSEGRLTQDNVSLHPSKLGNFRMISPHHSMSSLCLEKAKSSRRSNSSSDSSSSRKTSGSLSSRKTTCSFIGAVKGHVIVWRMSKGEDVKGPFTNAKRYHMAAMVVRFCTYVKMESSITAAELRVPIGMLDDTERKD